jgi:hypothetical protein
VDPPDGPSTTNAHSLLLPPNSQVSPPPPPISSHYPSPSPRITYLVGARRGEEEAAAAATPPPHASRAFASLIARRPPRHPHQHVRPREGVGARTTLTKPYCETTAGRAPRGYPRRRYRRQPPPTPAPPGRRRAAPSRPSAFSRSPRLCNRRGPRASLRAFHLSRRRHSRTDSSSSLRGPLAIRNRLCSQRRRAPSACQPDHLGRASWRAVSLPG